MDISNSRDTTPVILEYGNCHLLDTLERQTVSPALSVQATLDEWSR